MTLIVKLFDHDVDVTEWQDKHPGGRKLLKIFENRDATQQFVAIHKGKAAKTILDSLKKTKSSPKSVSYSAVEEEFNELIVKLRPTLSQVSVPYEVVKLLYIFTFAIVGYYLCFTMYKYVGLSMLCLSMYQSGWVGHDYSHRSVLSSPKMNNLMADVLGFIQGYSDIWWKLRHNTHHMVTNEIGNDPDVKTEPVFHFYDRVTNELRTSPANAAGGGRKVPTAHLPFQQGAFTFMLCLLDVFWRYESLSVLSKSPSKYFWNLTRLAAHYVCLLVLLLRSNVTVGDFIALSLVRGFMTAVVVFANHYPEDRLPPSHGMGLFEQTLRTSRNTTGLLVHHGGDGFLRRLFNEGTGYLSMQIEHHLAPTWPSGNLMQLRPHVMALAKKYDLPYHETSILGATIDNIQKLSDYSLEQLKKIQ